ncbi:MAG: iron-containing alcohol dehydrogenase [Caldilineaceae bacterium]
MNFEFATANRIIFGPGTLKQVGPIAASLGKQAIVITGSKPERAQPLFDELSANGIDHTTFTVTDEPTVADTLAIKSAITNPQSAIVIAFGGGSVLDMGKAIAALLTNPGDPLDYLEVVGKGKPPSQASAPMIAIPTTSGTGSEVTRNSVLAVPEKQVKVSMRSPTMLPKVAIVDPLLTLSVPPNVTAFTGMDALTQCLEPLVSSRANPLTDGIAWEGLRRAARSLQRAVENGSDAAAREEMAFASLCGGLALANSGLGAVHGFAGPFGGMFHAPHGAICAALLAPVMQANVNALRERAPQHPALARFATIAEVVCDSSLVEVEDGIERIAALTKNLKISLLSSYGFSRSDFATLIPKAQAASSMKANPIPLTDAELTSILEQAL